LPPDSVRSITIRGGFTPLSFLVPVALRKLRPPCSLTALCAAKKLATLSTIAALSAAFVTSVSSVASAQTSGPPGAVPNFTASVNPDPGGAYPWEGSVGGTNTGNGNKVTTVPLVGWTAQGGLPVSLSLTHNSQETGSSELGPKWIHSYAIYGVVDPNTSAFSVRWGDGLGYAFTYDWYTDSYLSPIGIYDALTHTLDSQGYVIAYTLTTKGGVKYRFENPNGNRWNCVSITDRNNNVITIAHNANDYVTGVTDPTGRTLTFAYNGSNKLVSVTDPLSRQFLFSYNSNGELSLITFPAPVQGSGNNPLISFGYDTGSRITAMTDPRGKTWTFNYDSGSGALLWEKDPLNHQTSYSYASSYTDITDPLGRTVRHNYSWGKLSSVVDPQTYTTSFGYDSSNNKTSITDARGEVSTFTYDSRGNVLTATGPTGHTVTTTYNSLDLPLTVTSHLGKVFTNTYDTNGNRLTAKNPLNQITSYGY
jgi:YD repeat-containing protein